jgi:hypothetical protein
VRNELAVPPQDRVRPHEGRDPRKYAATEPVPQLGESSSLGVIEPQSAPFEPRL